MDLPKPASIAGPAGGRPLANGVQRLGGDPPPPPPPSGEGVRKPRGGSFVLEARSLRLQLEEAKEELLQSQLRAGLLEEENDRLRKQAASRHEADMVDQRRPSEVAAPRRAKEVEAEVVPAAAAPPQGHFADQCPSNGGDATVVNQLRTCRGCVCRVCGVSPAQERTSFDLGK